METRWSFEDFTKEMTVSNLLSFSLFFSCVQVQITCRTNAESQENYLLMGNTIFFNLCQKTNLQNNNVDANSEQSKSLIKQEPR